jgi:1,2-diacylglycerol-3-alpha-glucose alpha-1,2-galactosyltransferase
VKSLHVCVLSKATTVPGQGVGAAYLEQLNLIRQSKNIEVTFKPSKHMQIMHVHTINLQYFFSMFFSKVPTVMYVHFLPSTLKGSIKLPKLFFVVFVWYIKKFYRRADFLVVVNPSFVAPLVKLGIPESRIKFIPNYVNPEQFKTDQSQTSLKMKLGIKGFMVLGVGQVQSRKGILDFVEVARRLPDVTFIWAGGFSFKGLTDGYDALKEVIENPPANVQFVGIIPRETIKDYYHASDLFFLPSYEELMPMSVLEAAVMDKPILLRMLSLYEPVFFHHYLKGTNIDSFVKVIQSLKSDPAYYANSISLSRQLRAKYDVSEMLKVWEDFYKEVNQHGKTH